MFLSLFYLLSVEVKIIPAITITTPPKIDGLFEELWTKSEVVSDFVQQFPEEGKPATESTKVYLLSDEKNIYLYFKSFLGDIKRLDKRVAERERAIGDRVGLYLDPFGDRNFAYYFSVNCGNVQFDGIFSERGRNFDCSWDGVWYSSTKIYPWGYAVEMKIPFKAISFQEGLFEWGINFERHIAYREERCHWFGQRRGYQDLARMGKLTGISPTGKGLNLEFYPVGLIRYEKEEKSRWSLSGGIDGVWNLTAETNLSLTFFPDFAQIEADPYRINISKYETYLTEKRPFFTQGREIFSIGTSSSLFYSRRIGRAFPDGRVVPIIGGLKFLQHSSGRSFGLLLAWTDSLLSKSYEEKRSRFLILAHKERVGRYLNLNLLGVEKRGVSSYNNALGIEKKIKFKDFFFNSLSSISLKTEEPLGYWQNLTLQWQGSNFWLNGDLNYINKNYNIDEIGYSTFRGKEISLVLGPQITNWGQFRSLSPSLGGGWRREIDWDRWGNYLVFWLSTYFKNLYFLWTGVTYSHISDIGLWYNSFNYYFSAASPSGRLFYISLYGYYQTKLYNYRRGYFAPYAALEISPSVKFSPQLSLSLTLTSNLEFDSLNKIDWQRDISIITRPYLTHSLNTQNHFRIYLESVRTFDLTEARVKTYHNLSGLYSYNFLPKSWLYFGLTYPLRKKRLPGSYPSFILKLKYLFLL